MSSKGPVTPKGFRDMDPETAKKRREIVNKLANVLENYGFVPLETPTIEFAETLLGKYGDEEKLIYQFEDRGGRKVALRYDLTVPLARYVANNLAVLKPSFARYQVGQIFRGENTQRGRYRESTQFDFDIVGTKSPEVDAQIVAAAIEGYRKIGFDKASLMINDRANFGDLSPEDIRTIDKIYKVGRENTPKNLLEFVEKTKPTENLSEIFRILKTKYSLEEGKDFFFDATLARGQDYYTGIIFEMKPYGKPEDLSVGGGGRYDNLIGMFAGRPIPAVGFSFGIDRIIDLMP